MALPEFRFAPLLLTTLTLSLGSAYPAWAETMAEPAPLDAAAFAPALIRTDSIAGAYEVVHWAEKGLIFVASTPSFEEGTGGVIHVLDATDLRPLRQIQLPGRPFALALDRSTGRLYAGNTLDGALSVIDAASGQVLEVIQLGLPLEEGVEHVRMIALDEAAGLGFVTSPGLQGLVWIIDLKTQKLLHRIDSGLWSAGAALDAKAGRFYASGGGIEEISVIDSTTGTRIGGISTGDTTEQDPNKSAHFFVNLSIDPAGQRLFAADSNTRALYMIDLANGKVAAQVPVGPGTLDVAYNPIQDEIYLTWRGVEGEDGGILVVDATDYTTKARLLLKGRPNSLELSADGQILFATMKAISDPKSPDYRKGALDTLLRLDLTRLFPRP